MIRYPLMTNNSSIGVTAPSSGLPDYMHHYLTNIRKRFEPQHEIIIGETVTSHHKAKSTDSITRAKELNHFFCDEAIDIIIPPFGGELALEIVDKIEYDQLKVKWLLGYSDISTLLLAITLRTGIATAHGPNLVDLRGSYSDKTTAMWKNVLETKLYEEIVQYSSEIHQSKWDHSRPTECVFNLDTKTLWKSTDARDHRIEGRLLGGCIDVINHLVGTPYGDVRNFRETHIKDEPLIWYLENCEVSPTELKRMLVQMQYACWFDNCNGLLFGRTRVTDHIDGYSIEDVYNDIANELGIPVIYDIDCGHMPPQMTFVNGAHAVIEYNNGKGKVTQKFV